MGIIATVGRRSFGVMTLVAAMYVLLIIGGITMVYPFLLMLSTATTTTSDMQEYRVIPAYWHDDNALYAKYLWLRYDTGRAADAPVDYNAAYFRQGASVSYFRKDENFGWPQAKGDQRSAEGDRRAVAMPPDIDPSDPDVIKRRDDLDRFLREAPTLWPGPPLMVTETTASEDAPGEFRRFRRLVTNPYGRPLDPMGLSTGLGNRYRTVGYIGASFSGLKGVGRDQWSEFLERFYTNPDNPGQAEVERIEAMVARHGRPYELWRQVTPGFDMPTSPSWTLVEGEYQQMDWLFYKAAWTTGAPLAAPGDAGPPGITPENARVLAAGAPQTQQYVDVLGRSAPWTQGHALRALRPTQIMPDFWKELRNRYMKIEQLNLALGLARYDRTRLDNIGRHPIEQVGRRVVLAAPVAIEAAGRRVELPETTAIALLRGLLGPKDPAPTTRPDGDGEPRMVLPPAIDVDWSALTSLVGVSREDIEALNERIEDAWLSLMEARGRRIVRIEPFKDFDEVYLSARLPNYPPLAREWRDYVVGRVPAQMIDFIGRDPTVQPADAIGPGEVVERRGEPAGGDSKKDIDFATRRLRLPAHAWRDFLSWQYAGDPAEFRRLYLDGASEQEVADRVRTGRLLYGPEYSQFSLARMPIAERDRLEFAAHSGDLRSHFLWGNFGVVLDELVLEGRAMFNTIVLIFLAIITHVTVNPLAAYALSRFRLKYTYKVLLFMLATMAFPPAVGMIPGFLLLKNFGLINTYAALVLPGIASGYTVFLLKGFFDALPQELYEAAEIDGAGKVTTFLNVTFPLSKPIFAIITLQSFTAAYSGFMWAFLICPDQKMWTIMVHLFNIQQWNPAPIAMAALVIAAVPTFLVFLFCQNVILRGIIIPSFK